MGKNKKLKRNFTKETQFVKKVNPLALTIFDQGGIPLTSSSNEHILRGDYLLVNFVCKISCNVSIVFLKSLI